MLFAQCMSFFMARSGPSRCSDQRLLLGGRTDINHSLAEVSL